LQRFLNAHAGRLPTRDYAGLYRWSITQPAAFWAACWDFCGIRATQPYATVLAAGEKMPGARWFDGACLNFAANLLRVDDESAAIVSYDERGDRIELSWAELRGQVASLSEALGALGVGPGDRVAGLLPNRPEAVVAMLATASRGAVWSSCSPDFGPRGVLDRFGQIGAKVLFVTDGYVYGGKQIDCLPGAAQVAERLETLQALIVVPYGERMPDLAGLANATPYPELVVQTPAPRYEPLPFAHPLYIVYSSGTTGVPKCIVHGAGGTLIQHQKEHLLHCDIKRGDRVFYFTTTGWMMWHWLVSALASGATLVLFDGSPFHPDPGVLWRIAERERLKLFGTSAKYLSALQKTGYRPGEHVSLEHLASVLSTGSPLAPSSFDFVYDHVKRDLQLSSVAGGTDLIACFAVGNPMLPVYRGELQCRGLGMKVEIFDEQGRSVRGRKGELVCTAPFPSMPVAFWNDPGDAQYRAAYFERFANVWCHGDFAELTAHDGLIIYGRSDAVLNPGGVRIGTAEIYRIVERFEEVAEAIAIGQQWDGDVRVVLFVRLQAGFGLDEALRDRLRSAVRRQASPRHVPARILAVADIPRTRSGKIVEIAVRDVVHGRDVPNTDALANPEALEHFKDRAELSE
ncbi:MAG: acetoacetate--CoA ligase, partial [Rhodospirillaceae bacterium]|nr:acetoacetate--CoA ligase [Rhodospirillaceae bacterium]